MMPSGASQAGVQRAPRVAIGWSAATIVELQQLASGPVPGRHPIESALAPALLLAAEGDFDQAEARVLQLMQEHVKADRTNAPLFFPFFLALFVVQRFDLAGRMLREHWQLDCATELHVSAPSPGFARVRWEIISNDHVRFVFDESILGHDSTRLRLLSFHWLFPLFADYLKRGAETTGAVDISLWDAGMAPGLAFCSNSSDHFLIPDNLFISSRAYEAVRRAYAENDVPWQQRQAVAFWRGTTTGHPLDPKIGWRSLPRIRLCELARQHGDLFDAGIAGISQMDDPTVQSAIRESGVMRPFVPAAEFNRYRYQIDIDGNTNSWPGLYQKLSTGSPVLKIASPSGYRQWYYHRLQPWINFVPIAADMSDLVEKVRWLRDHDDAARAIGEQGRALARSLDYAGELQRAGRTITAALRYFAGRPETTLEFGTGSEANAHLLAGWTTPQTDGVPATGSESHLSLPRPIADKDFVLTLELSPSTETDAPRAQRVGIVVNGETLQDATLPTRMELRCSVPRRVIAASDALSITLLHPDHAQAASAARPLDGRSLSIVLHRLALTPADIAGASAQPVQPALANLPTLATHQGAVMEALYGRDVWHGFVPVRPRAPEVQGWNGRHPVFARLLDKIPNTTVIDQGVWKGQSTIYVAELMRQRRMDGCVIAIDAFLAEEHWPAEGRLFARHSGGRPDVYETFLENVFHAGVADLVVPLPAQSIAAARLLARRGIKAGLIHLDASRDHAEVLRDVEAYWQLLEPGGYLVGDDYGPGFPGVVKAADEFAAKVRLELEIQPPKWLLRKPALVPSRPEAPPTSLDRTNRLPGASGIVSAQVNELDSGKRMPEITNTLMHKLYGHDVWEGFRPAPVSAEVQGWNGNHPSLARLASDEGAKVVIDVGVWKGQSTITMAHAMRNRNIDGCVIAIDTFLGSPEHWSGPISLFERENGHPDLYRTFLSNVYSAGLTGYVIPMPQTSITAAKILGRLGVAASVIHLDAAHEYEEVMRDAMEYWKLLKPGGYLIGDDYSKESWPGVVKAADEFAAKVGLELEIQPPKWLLRKPALVPGRPQAPPDATLPIDSKASREALLASVERQVQMPAAELMLAFESLGQNCEFGIVQRYCGAEPLGLLRFSSTFLDRLLRALDGRFDGVGAPGSVTVQLTGSGRKEFMVQERTYDLVYHAWKYEGDIEASELAALETKKLGFLRRKLLEDLETAKKIFVWRGDGPTPESAALALHDRLNRYGRNTMLWVVTRDDAHPEGTVEVLRDGLLKGYIDRFAPASNVWDLSLASWLKVCVRAYMMLNGMSETPVASNAAA